jgi:hypothetical protein
MVIQAGAETMNFKLVSMVEKREMVKVTETVGAMRGVMDRKGLSIFNNGEIPLTELSHSSIFLLSSVSPLRTSLI